MEKKRKSSKNPALLIDTVLSVQLLVGILMTDKNDDDDIRNPRIKKCK